MNAGKVIGRVVATSKYSTVEGKKILMLQPLSWEELESALNNKDFELPPPPENSVLALDSVGAGAGEYVFYVSSKEAAQAFEDDPICHNAVIGIVDGISIKEDVLK